MFTAWLSCAKDRTLLITCDLFVNALPWFVSDPRCIMVRDVLNGPRRYYVGPRHLEMENMDFVGPSRIMWVRVVFVWVRDIFRSQNTQFVGPRCLNVGPRHMWVRDGLRNKSLRRLPVSILIVVLWNSRLFG